MSIQKFNSLEDGKLFYIKNDVIENDVHTGTFIDYTKPDVKTRYKTTWVYVDDAGKKVEVCNRDCYRTVEEATEARKKKNEELMAKLIKSQRHNRIMIDGYKRNINSLEDALKFILAFAYVNDYQLSAFVEKIKEYTGIDVPTDNVGSEVYDDED